MNSHWKITRKDGKTIENEDFHGMENKDGLIIFSKRIETEYIVEQEVKTMFTQKTIELPKRSIRDQHLFAIPIENIEHMRYVPTKKILSRDIDKEQTKALGENGAQ